MFTQRQIRRGDIVPRGLPFSHTTCTLYGAHLHSVYVFLIITNVVEIYGVEVKSNTKDIVWVSEHTIVFRCSGLRIKLD